MLTSTRRTGPRFLRLREEVLEYLWQRFPHHCIIMTDPQTRGVIDLPAERAGLHGFRESEQVSSWVTLMIFFGSYFDEDDPLCPWASETLSATSSQGREIAMQRLFSAMNEATKPIVGETGELYRKALLWVVSERFDTLSAVDERSVGDAIGRWLRIGFPAKYASLTPAQLGLLISESETRAREFGLEQRT